MKMYEMFCNVTWCDVYVRSSYMTDVVATTGFTFRTLYQNNDAKVTNANYMASLCYIVSLSEDCNNPDSPDNPDNPDTK